MTEEAPPAAECTAVSSVLLPSWEGTLKWLLEYSEPDVAGARV